MGACAAKDEKHPGEPKPRGVRGSGKGGGAGVDWEYEDKPRPPELPKFAYEGDDAGPGFARNAIVCFGGGGVAEDPPKYLTGAASELFSGLRGRVRCSLPGGKIEVVFPHPFGVQEVPAEVLEWTGRTGGNLWCVGEPAEALWDAWTPCTVDGTPDDGTVSVRWGDGSVTEGMGACHVRQTRLKYSAASPQPGVEGLWNGAWLPCTVVPDPTGRRRSLTVRWEDGSYSARMRPEWVRPYSGENLSSSNGASDSGSSLLCPLCGLDISTHVYCSLTGHRHTTLPYQHN